MHKYNMGVRKVPLILGEIYHVFNRSIARQPIFLSDRHYRRIMEVIQYYIYLRPPLRFSHYDRLNAEKKREYFDRVLSHQKRQVEIFAYCIMPNHFHFLMKELESGGITRFMRKIEDSYAKFFNLKHDRSGSLFQEMFKAEHIETDEQLIHVCRYIHLNPYTAYIVKNLNDLENYPWSSLPEYLGKRKPTFVSTDLILNFFTSREEFKKFTFDQADYQRELDKIKHLTLD